MNLFIHLLYNILNIYIYIYIYTAYKAIITLYLTIDLSKKYISKCIFNVERIRK